MIGAWDLGYGLMNITKAYAVIRRPGLDHPNFKSYTLLVDINFIIFWHLVFDKNIS